MLTIINNYKLFIIINIIAFVLVGLSFYASANDLNPPHVDSVAIESLLINTGDTIIDANNKTKGVNRLLDELERYDNLNLKQQVTIKKIRKEILTHSDLKEKKDIKIDNSNSGLPYIVNPEKQFDPCQYGLKSPICD